jgi:glycosyltransferase involved in cell wall biosynthesis
MSDSKTFNIGMVVPCYNEGNRISIAAFEEDIIAHENHFYCFVNDGSSDNTLAILQKFADKYPLQIEVLNNPHNMGKAETVRNGVNHLYQKNNSDIIGFLDADLATPLEEVERIVTVFNDKHKLIVFGSRIMHMGGHIHRKFIRFVLGRMFATVVSVWILKTPIYDTQCGFKFFRPSIIPIIFSAPFKSKWFFDIELFCKTIQYFSNQQINEIAQEFFLKKWNDVKGSKIKLSDYFKVPLELLKLKSNYKL